MTVSTFNERLRSLINEESIDSAYETPDFILTELIMGLLTVYSRTVNRRDEWDGVQRGIAHPGPIQSGQSTAKMLTEEQAENYKNLKVAQAADKIMADRSRILRERDEAHRALQEAAAAYKAKDQDRLRLILCDKDAQTLAYRLNIEHESLLAALEEERAKVAALLAAGARESD